MEGLVSYEFADGVATLTLDDGKVNVMSVPMQAAINGALDRADADGAAVVIAGRPGVFSAGFDLVTLQAGGAAARAMVAGGYGLAARVLGFPHPVVSACTGHAIAMGSFLMCSADYRVGAAGPYKLMANEVAIGIPLPLAAIMLLRDRLIPSVLSRATTLAEPFTPDNAVVSGWLDEVTPAEDVVAVAQARARLLAALPRAAHTETKRLVRRSTLDELAAHIAAGAGLGLPE